MILEIASVTCPTDALWDQVWEACDYGTYYHSRHWARLWEQYAPAKHRAAPRLVTFTDGMQALLPLTITRHPLRLIEFYESSPYDTYGGWISVHPLTGRHAAVLAAYLRAQPNMNWMTNPFEPTQTTAAGEGEAASTRVIELGQGSQALGKKTRYAARFAANSGVTLRPIAGGDLDAVYDVYVDDRLRHTEQRHIFDRHLFALLRGLPRADFVGAFHTDRLIAATLALRSKRHVAVWLAFARAETLLYKPFQFMTVSLVERYAAAGYTWYDIHAGGERTPGERAKTSTGGTPLHLSIIRTPTPAYRAANWAHGIAERILSDRE